MTNTRTSTVTMHALQHELTLVDLRQLAEWLEKRGNRIPGVDHGTDTIAARLRDLHDRLTAYETDS
jgi:hypothetical protein